MLPFSQKGNPTLAKIIHRSSPSSNFCWVSENGMVFAAPSKRPKSTLLSGTSQFKLQEVQYYIFGNGKRLQNPSTLRELNDLLQKLLQTYFEYHAYQANNARQRALRSLESKRQKALLPWMVP